MQPDACHKTRTLCLTGMLHGFTHLYGVALLPLYLLIQHDFGFQSVEKATSLMTVMLVAYFAPSYPLGMLADRLSRKKLLTAGLAVNALAFVGLSFAPNYFWALTAVVVAGLGGSCYHPAATAMIARLFPQTTGRALGLAGIGAGAGFFLGPLYTGWRAAMLEPSVGAAAWRRPILEIGVLGLIAAALFAALAREEVVQKIGDMKKPGGEKLFPTPTLWFFFVACCFMFGLRDFAGNGMASLASLFLQKAQGFNTRHASTALSGLFLASMISNPLLGSLSDGRRKRWITLVIGVGAVLMAIFPRLPAGWTLPCFVAFGFFFQASYPIVEAALMQSVPDAVRGRVFGFFVTITGLLGGVSHWVAGAMVRQLGDGAARPENYYHLYGALAGLGLIALLGVPCLHAIRKREHLDDPTVPNQSPIGNRQSAIP